MCIYFYSFQIAVYSVKTGKCGCIQSSFELQASFPYEKTCKCQLSTVKNDKKCSDEAHWFILSASNVIDLVDSEVGT